MWRRRRRKRGFELELRDEVLLFITINEDVLKHKRRTVRGFYSAIDRQRSPRIITKI